MGGTGKSFIASYFYKYLDQNTNFAAKFWADVSLKPDFTVFAEKIIIALGGKVAYPLDITELINNLLSLLSQRRCMLVVDNLETLLDKQRNWQDEYYQQFFSRWLQQGTNSTLLITTQDKPQLFQSLQSWYPLGGMKITEGVELFHNLGIIAREEELQEFVEYVQGHPLTIKLVAGFLISDCDSQFSQVEELELERFELAYQEASGSHRNKEDARLAWIIQQHLFRLNPEQRKFLDNLSVYRLPFNLDAASFQLPKKKQKQSLLDKLLRKKPIYKQTKRKIDIQKSLQELCNRSLLIKTEDRKFQFESLVQKYIQQQANDLTNAHQQAIQYYQLHLKEESSWQVREDISEYLEIIYHYCELEQYALANEIISICGEFLNLRGYYSVLVEIYEKLRSGWQQNLQPEDRSEFANSLNNLGNAYHSLGEYQRAIDYHQQSLAIAQQLGDRSGEGASLGNLGLAYNSLREYQRAIDYHQQSLAIQQQIGERYGEAASLNNLGLAYSYLGEYQRAIDYHQQSLAIAQQIGERYGEGLSLNNLGLAYSYLGEYQRAIDYHQQSLAIQQQIGDRNGEGNSLNNLGSAYYSLGEYQRAIDYHQQSLAIAQQLGDRNGEGNSLIGLGSAYYSLGEYQRAIDFYQQSLAIQQQLGDRNGEGNSLIGLGNAYDSLGEYQRAIDYHQ